MMEFSTPLPKGLLVQHVPTRKEIIEASAKSLFPGNGMYPHAILCFLFHVQMKVHDTFTRRLEAFQAGES